MKENLIRTPGHIFKARDKSVSARSFKGLASGSLLSPVMNDIRTRKLMMISAMFEDGLNSSSTTPMDGMDLSVSVSGKSLTISSFSSSSSFELFLVEREPRVARPGDFDSVSSFFVFLPPFFPRLGVVGSSSFSGLSSALRLPGFEALGKCFSSPAPDSLSVSQFIMSSTRSIESDRFAWDELVGNPKRDKELTICGTNCALDE